VAWLSATLRSNWTAAPRSAFHGFTVRVTLRPPRLVVEVRCPSAAVAVAGTSAEGSGTAEAIALEVLAPPIATIAAAVVTSTAHRRPRNLRRSPTPSGYRSSGTVGRSPLSARISRQDTRMVFVVFLPPRAVTSSFFASGCWLASTKVFEPARVSLNSTVARVPPAIE